MKVRGFFTAFRQQPRFPHSPVPLRLILATHLAVTRAFQILKSEGFVFAKAKEDDITRALHSVMENRLLRSKEVPGFDIRRIKNVVRAPEVANYDNKHPAKKPDLVLFLLRHERMSASHSLDAVFAECKPVDDDHSIGKHYCDRGIRRFIDGDYAWTMQEGMVIAYVRGGRTIAKDLAPVLASNRRNAELGSCGPPVIIHSTQGGEPLHSTLHRRPFVWPAEAGPACDILIFHSWHNCI
jgi:hypothetical protein